MDIGAGDGNFLSGLDPVRFDKYALEINPEAIKILTDKKIKTYLIPLKDLKLKDEFDMVTLWHVFEHLDKPLELLADVHLALKKDGNLIMQVPNNNSLGFKWGLKHWYHLDSPRHLFIPNKRSIEIAAKASGFEILNIKNEFFDYPLDLFWSIRYSYVRFIIYPLYPLFKIFSKEHLTFILKKK